MRKQILTDKETKAYLAESFGCTKVQVWRALNFERNSAKAQRIRQAALNRGGKLLNGYIPQCATEHDEASHIMRVTFGPRVRIEGNRDNGEVKVFVDDRQHGETYSGLTVPDFMQLQHEVELLAQTI